MQSIFFNAIAILLLPTLAAAHGINGHVWVSDQGLAKLPLCHDEIHAIFDDPENLETFQFAAGFPDSGYTMDKGRAYGETAHWEPFLQGYIEHLRRKYDGDYRSPEAMRDVAFVMGLAQHGMQDEVFDTIFMYKAEEEDASSQDLLDTGTDFVIVEDGVSNLTPEAYFPDDVVDVFADLGVDVDLGTIKQGTQIIRSAVIGLLEIDDNDGLADEYRTSITWAVDHFLDADQPGSHAFEQSVVAPYVAAIWERLHDRELGEQALIGTAPQSEHRLLSNDHTSVDSWFTAIFGIGLRNADINADHVQVLDATGGPVDVEVRRVRWGGEDDTTRLVQIRPKADWPHDGQFYLELSPDIRRIDGKTLGVPISVGFRSACADGRSCPTLEDEPPQGPVCAETVGDGCSARSQGDPHSAVGLMSLLGIWWFSRRGRVFGRD